MTVLIVVCAHRRGAHRRAADVNTLCQGVESSDRAVAYHSSSASLVSHQARAGAHDRVSGAPNYLRRAPCASWGIWGRYGAVLRCAR